MRRKIRNPIDRGDGTFAIPLTRGMVAIVDADAVPIISAHTWQAYKTKHNTYARTRAKGAYIGMHRMVTGCPPGLVPDHINFNTLDNRRCNLRVVRPDQNNRHRRDCAPIATMPGITYMKDSKRRRRWWVRVNRKSIGLFATEAEATAAYEAARANVNQCS